MSSAHARQFPRAADLQTGSPNSNVVTLQPSERPQVLKLIAAVLVTEDEPPPRAPSERFLGKDRRHPNKPFPSTTQVHQLLASTTVMSPMWLMESFTPSNCLRNSAVCHVGDNDTNLGA